jgi:hypothetical protein
MRQHVQQQQRFMRRALFAFAPDSDIGDRLLQSFTRRHRLGLDIESRWLDRQQFCEHHRNYLAKYVTRCLLVPAGYVTHHEPLRRNRTSADVRAGNATARATTAEGRLKGDGFWELRNAEQCSTEGSRQPPSKELETYHVDQTPSRRRSLPEYSPGNGPAGSDAPGC